MQATEGPFSARMPRFLATFSELPTIPPISAHTVAFFSNLRRFRQADPSNPTARPCRRPVHGVAAIFGIATSSRKSSAIRKKWHHDASPSRFARGAGHVWLIYPVLSPHRFESPQPCRETEKPPLPRALHTWCAQRDSNPQPRDYEASSACPPPSQTTSSEAGSKTSSPPIAPT